MTLHGTFMEQRTTDRIAEHRTAAEASRARRVGQARQRRWWPRVLPAEHDATGSPRPMPPPLHTHDFAEWAADAAARVAGDGIDNHAFEVSALARIAEQRHVNSAVVAALRDNTLSRALRERAFGYILIALSRSQRIHPHTPSGRPAA